ncbi:MAG: CHASE3 domain-containing protein [Bacteroidota bacterium]|nr:CHASE3 domain-containing protein [Bacteroidota bacterium]
MVRNFLKKIANRTRIGFLTAFFLLLISYILTYISTQKIITQDHWINHTNEIIHNLDNILRYIKKGESAFRGYVITKNPQFIDEFEQSKTDTYDTFSTLDSLTIENNENQNNLDTLHDLIDQNFSGTEKILSDFSAAQTITPGLLEGNGLGIEATKNIEKYVSKIRDAEKKLWSVRSKSVSEYSVLIKILNIISLIVAILLTFSSILVYNKENKAKTEADKKAAEFREQLQNRVDQLAELNTELIELRNLEKYAVTGRIARTIAHEVRNPLTNINLSIEHLRSEQDLTESSAMLFNMISRNSDRINQLVSDLLNTTRVAELSFSEASVNDLLDQSLELARDRIELNHIKVEKNYDEDICPISVDVSKIKIAFLNIIVNAIEAMDENGILQISTSRKNSMCIIKISDTGKGMTKSEVSRLFEPYFTTKEKGNGLGLANSQNIILGHDGSISAESELGSGTTFTISLRIS